MDRRTINSALFSWATFGFAVVSAVILNRQLVRTIGVEFEKKSRDSESVVSFRWNPDLYRILAFGHIPASVDWLMIRFMTDSNIAKINDGRETEVFRILDLATEIDPAFFTLYTGGTNFLGVIRNDLRGARKLIEKGATFIEEKLPDYPQSVQEDEWKDAWRIYMLQGYLYLFEFQDVENASSAFGKMDRYPGVAESMAGLAKSIRTPEGQFKVSLNALKVIKGWYENDAVMTEALEGKERLLKLGQSLYHWNRDFEAFKPKGREGLQSRFERFRREANIPDRDLFGGRIFLNEKGRIDSTTPRGKVFGLTF